jgi:hypothetical protein
MNRTRQWLTATGLATLAALLTVLTLSGQAQPPGLKGKFGFGKQEGKFFRGQERERLEGERKDGERKDGQQGWRAEGWRAEGWRA